MMNSKIVYVLTSDTSDFYLEQLSLSLYSLRLYNSNITVEIVMDSITFESLNAKRRNLISEANIVTSIHVPDSLNKMQRSRWLKTNLRNLIDGDFLFLDTDTVICGEIDLQTMPNQQICAVKDLHVNINEHAHQYDILSRAKLIDWQISDLNIPYHNSGVMWVKDTQQTRAFYKLWNEEWMKSMKAGCSSDQPALCKVNDTYNDFIHPLEDKWNCQVTENGLIYLNTALILHYFASGKKLNNPPFILDNIEIYKEIRDYGITGRIKDIIKKPKSAFFYKIQLLSDTDITFFQSPLCQYLRRFYYSSPKLYNRIVSIGRKFKHL